MSRALTPKGCAVRQIKLDGKGNAELRFGCIGKDHRETYTSRKVKAHEVSHRGVHIGGNSSMNFTVSPAIAVCSMDTSGARRSIRCKMVGDTSAPSL